MPQHVDLEQWLDLEEPLLANVHAYVRKYVCLLTFGQIVNVINLHFHGQTFGILL